MPDHFLSGNKIYLRGLTKEDCREQYLSMVNDVENLFFIEGIGYHPLTTGDLERYIEANNNYANLLLGIFQKGTNLHVGNIHLSQIKPYHNNCILGILMHRDHMGKGYAHEAINILIKHAFEVLNIHRIQINVVDKNIRAIKLYEKIGAVKEGVLREAFYLANKYHDVIVYSLLKQDYLRELKSDKRD